MQNKGLHQSSILRELEFRLRNDFTYGSGRIIGSMCTCPHPRARVGKHGCVLMKQLTLEELKYGMQYHL